MCEAIRLCACGWVLIRGILVAYRTRRRLQPSPCFFGAGPGTVAPSFSAGLTSNEWTIKQGAHLERGCVAWLVAHYWFYWRPAPLSSELCPLGDAHHHQQHLFGPSSCSMEEESTLRDDESCFLKRSPGLFMHSPTPPIPAPTASRASYDRRIWGQGFWSYARAGVVRLASSWRSIPCQDG